MSEQVPACPLCGGNQFTKVYLGNIDSSEDPSRYFSSSRQIAGHWPIVRCNGCGLVMSNPRDSQTELSRIYQSLNDEQYQVEGSNRAILADERLRDIEGWAKPARLLDLGCSTGIFCGRAAARGWAASGADPSAWSIAQARRAFPSAAFIESTIERLDLPDNSYDVVTLWDVLEHVADPRIVLTRAFRWLAPGGLLVMNIPNIQSLTSRMMGKYWVLLLREHLWYFSPATIRRMLEQNGFVVRVVRPNQVRFSLANLFTRLSQYPHMKVLQKLAAIKAMNAVSVRFSMGEMTVVAVKPPDQTS